MAISSRKLNSKYYKIFDHLYLMDDNESIVVEGIKLATLRSGLYREIVDNNNNYPEAQFDYHLSFTEEGGVIKIEKIPYTKDWKIQVVQLDEEE